MMTVSVVRLHLWGPERGSRLKPGGRDITLVVVIGCVGEEQARCSAKMIPVKREHYIQGVRMERN